MPAAQIRPEEIESREQVGEVDGAPVYHLACRGGLQIVATKHPSGRSEILGAAGHPAIAIFIAKTHCKNKRLNASWTKLAKSEYPVEAFQDQLPKWQNVTTQLRRKAAELWAE